jgi:hypothetical protein
VKGGRRRLRNGRSCFLLLHQRNIGYVWTEAGLTYRRLHVATSVLPFPTLSVSDRLSRVPSSVAEPCCLSLDHIQRFRLIYTSRMSQSAKHGLMHEVVVEQCSERLSVFNLCILSQTNKAMNETMMLAPCWKALFIEAVKVFSVFLTMLSP